MYGNDADDVDDVSVVASLQTTMRQCSDAVTPWLVCRLVGCGKQDMAGHGISGSSLSRPLLLFDRSGQRGEETRSRRIWIEAGRSYTKALLTHVKVERG
jgi:hypothetical protein